MPVIISVSLTCYSSKQRKSSNRNKTQDLFTAWPERFKVHRLQSRFSASHVTFFLHPEGVPGSVDPRLEIRQEMRESALLSSLPVAYPNISHDALNDFAACTALRFINTTVFSFFSGYTTRENWSFSVVFHSLAGDSLVI